MRGPLCLWHRFMNCKKLWISFEKGTEEPLRCLDLVTMASVSCTWLISWGEREIVTRSKISSKWIFPLTISFPLERNDQDARAPRARGRCCRRSAPRRFLELGVGSNWWLWTVVAVCCAPARSPHSGSTQPHYKSHRPSYHCSVDPRAARTHAASPQGPVFDNFNGSPPSRPDVKLWLKIW